MKKATVADLRNHFRRVSSWIENGEPVEIVKRGKIFARLMPVTTIPKPEKIDYRAQLRETWGGRVFSNTEVKAMREAELEGEEG